MSSAIIYIVKLILSAIAKPLSAWISFKYKQIDSRQKVEEYEAAKTIDDRIATFNELP